MATYMPSRGERAAPVFDQTKPRELSRFFNQLEKLFVRNNVTVEATMKEHVLEYVDFDVEQLWKIFPEYADVNKTYIDFKDAIQVHYPDAKGDHVYALRDLELLIENRLRDGIETTDDLQNYHLTYLAITTWLIEKDQMGDFEQRKNYMRAFQQPLLAAIRSNLRMNFLKHPPNTPHKIQDVHEAARYVLQDEDIAPRKNYYSPIKAPVTAAPQPAATNDLNIKQETFATVMASFSKTIADALGQSSRPRVSAAQTGTRQTDCNFCGGPHYIRECSVVDEYVLAGKCRRNFEGKVVLSTGSFVPRDIPGTLLRERVDEWHHRNPNQLSVASLVHTISAEHIRAHTEGQTTPAFQLSTTDRITALEAELFNLRAKRSAFIPIAKTRAQRAREQPLEATIEEVEEEDEPVREKTPTAPVVTTTAPAAVPDPPIVIIAKPPAIQEHPYHLAKDAAYAPPTARNVGGIVKLPLAKTTAPAYKTLPPVHEAAIAVDVYKRAMDASITITQRELLSLSPEVRNQVRDATTTKRIPTIPAATLKSTIENEEQVADECSSFALERPTNRALPSDATIVPDPIESYYESLEPGEVPDLDRLTVAKESTAIRSIFALVDATQKKECIVDPGCQVIAMSETACHSLSLPYDPKIRLNMESANGTFDWSLGLARNVPFRIGTITLYLQVHVIRSPSYEILLGRPFDVLTESVIRNFNNEDQTITITDPNSGAQCTLPTFARGSNKSHNTLQPDF